MTKNLETAFRSTISHAALSAGVALSWTAMSSDAAVAQQPTNPPGSGGGRNIQLDRIDVEGQSGGGVDDGAFNVPVASSPKMTAPLLDTPQTVTVIPRAVFQEQGARNLTEVLRNTPGISFDAGENGFSTSAANFKLRGFDSSGNIFIDNARDSGSYTRDTFNIERVEVFKGAAADNGRGGAGGYVNMVTKTPTLQNFIGGDVGYGWDQYKSEARKRATVDLNYVIAPNTAFRFNGLLEDSGVAGRDVAEMNPRGFAPSLAFGLGTDFRSIFAYEHVKRKDLPDWGVPGQTIPGTYLYKSLTAGASRDAFYGLRSDFDDTTANTFLARFEYDFSKSTTLSNQTRWARVDRQARFTLPNPPTNAAGESWGNTMADLTAMPTQTQYYDRLNTSLTNQTNLATEFFTGAFKHRVSMGLEFTREESEAGEFGTSNAGNTDLFNPNPDRQQAGWNPWFLQGSNSGKVNTVAAYLYDTIELNRHWEITGGLRAERYKVELGSNPAGLFNGYQESQTTLGGKIGLVYKPVENGSIYVSYGVSHQPPGSFLSNADISRTADDQVFPGLVMGAKPVRADNYEVGVKWDFFNRRLSTAIALFRTEKSNVPVAVNANQLLGYHEQVVQGVELSAAGYITDNWQVFGGIAFLDSERKISSELNDALRAANAADFGTYTTVNGNELAFTPDVTANLWTTYRLPYGWTIGGGLNYASASWVGRPDDALRIIPNGRFGELPGYTVFHAMASYEVTKDIVVRFNVDNITNKTYASSLNWSTRKAQLGAPRTFRISASFKF